MKLIPYVLATLAFYAFSLVRLKARTEQEKIGSTPVVFNFIIFFAIFEFFFIDSISHPLFHVLGLFIALACSLSIYFYLKNLKKDVESIFYKLVQQSQGKISILTFMQRTELSLEEATEFLEEKLQHLGGDTYETLGNIYYEFYRW
jgi:hypothetical protein